MDSRLGLNQTDGVLEERVAVVLKLGFLSKDAAEWGRKWIRLRRNAEVRGVTCNLSFKQYMKLARRAGLTRPREVGKEKGTYQMSRIGDTGDYEWGNCRFLTMEENKAEMITNGGRAAMAVKLKGRTKANGSPGALSRSKKMERPFRLVSPVGKIHKGKNLKVFCEKNGLDRANMGRVMNYGGTHKGWTGDYLDV